jgi:hypothetical protein
MLRNRDTTMAMDRDRDNQQYVLDHLVKTTGREQNFQYDERRFPPEAKTYRMIPRVLFKEAAHKEAIARKAEDAGHALTAIQLYHHAIEDYRHGQHAFFEDDNAEKIYMHGRMSACYDRIIELSEGRIERIEIEWDGGQYSGILHLTGVSKPAPLVLLWPGMYMSNEAMPHPVNNV